MSEYRYLVWSAIYTWPRWTCVYTTPLLNEIKLRLRDATHAQCIYNTLCMLLHTLPYLLLLSSYQKPHYWCPQQLYLAIFLVWASTFCCMSADSVSKHMLRVTCIGVDTGKDHTHWPFIPGYHLKWHTPWQQTWIVSWSDYKKQGIPSKWPKLWDY